VSIARVRKVGGAHAQHVHIAFKCVRVLCVPFDIRLRVGGRLTTL
jgi:hypothetical protein